MYLRSFIVKKFGPASKIVWLPKAWGFSRGELVHIEAKIDGKLWHETCNVKAGSKTAVYVTIPHFWPVEWGDIMELGIVYATVPAKPTAYEKPVSIPSTEPTEPTVREDGKDEYPGTVD